MDTSKTINITCKPEDLESYFFSMMFAKGGNNAFAESMGIHPSTASRDKNRIFKLACKAIAQFGLPAEAVSLPDLPSKVVIEGEYAELLIKAINKSKRKAPTTVNGEAQDQMELTI